MTFALLWRRDGAPSDPGAVARLAVGLTRLRDDPVRCWSRGPLALWHFADDPYLSIAEHPAGFVAILAGRLDAFEATIARLGGRAVLGERPSDAAVLAAAYERWGRACFPHLLGDFAAIVWHPRERTLLAARDRVGVAPLYWWGDDADVVLAGHLGGVMAHDAVPTVPNPGYVAEVLADAIHSRDETLYRDVRRLVAGHARLFRERGDHGWEWAPEISREVVRYSGPDEEAAAYRAVLTEAIRDRVRPPVRVGAEVSGGLDSSSVAALAAGPVRERDGEPLRSYSLVFPRDPVADERRFIEDVASTVGLAATLVDVTPPTAYGWVAEAARTRDLPLAPNAAPWVDLRRAARHDGVRALLTGQGGDQEFDVDDTYPLELFLHGRVRGAVRAAHRRWPGFDTPTILRWALVRPALVLGVRSVRPGIRPPAVPPWISPALAREAHLAERLTPTVAPPATAQRHRLLGYTAGWEAHMFDLSRLVEVQSGVAAMPPFHDARVAQFAVSLPEAARWADGQFRTVQRAAVAGLLPDSVRLREDKADFTGSVRAALSSAEGQARLARLRIAADVDWVSADAVGEALAALRSGESTMSLWPLVLILAVDCWFDAVM